MENSQLKKLNEADPDDAAHILGVTPDAVLEVNKVVSDFGRENQPQVSVRRYMVNGIVYAFTPFGVAIEAKAMVKPVCLLRAHDLGYYVPDIYERLREERLRGRLEADTHVLQRLSLIRAVVIHTEVELLRQELDEVLNDLTHEIDKLKK